MGRAHPRLSPLSSAAPFLLWSVYWLYFSLSESEEKEEEVEEKKKEEKKKGCH